MRQDIIKLIATRKYCSIVETCIRFCIRTIRKDIELINP
uniref:CSON011357 protein n=1 Tax=Culicoides sonorensis TaxID=179676 RepID=A0A336KJA7_CULSO